MSMNPVALEVCEFLSDTLFEGFSLGLGKAKVSFGKSLNPYPHPLPAKRDEIVHFFRFTKDSTRL